MRARGSEMPAGGEFDPEVDRIFWFWASLLRKHAEDARQEMWARWARYGSRARYKRALAHTIGRSVVISHFRSRGRSREDPVEPTALAERSGQDRTRASDTEAIDDKLDAAWAVGLIPKLLDDLCPPVEQTRKRASFLIKREIFEKTFGEKRSDADVANELGYTERWVRQCRRDLMLELLPLIWRRYRSDDEDGSARSADKP